MAKILVADDEKDILEVLCKKIADAGYEVVSAKDGQEALDKIYKEAPDVILLDVRMPKLDGFEVLKRLREKPLPNKWQPVIIVSALGELEDMKKGYSLEADYYIVKPCDILTILNGIETMLHLIPVRRLPGEVEGPSA
ncbi:MAG: response regulator transcription factor [Candidatus Omnitrophota bacterium]